MKRTRVLASAALLAALGMGTAGRGTASAQTPPAAPAYLTLGGYNVLCLRGTAGGMDPAQRVDVIMSRVTPLLGDPNILPSDVVVYLPPPTSRVNRYPVIYALGRRIVTVDPATVKDSGLIQTPLQAATLWAKKLQQVLPRVNWRPSNAPETKVPANPPLLITPDFTKVGGQAAFVALRGKTVLVLRGPQTGGMTAAERGDLLTARLKHLANMPGALAPDAVQVTDQPGGDATLAVAGTSLISVTTADAKAAGITSPSALAQSWAKNLRIALAASNSVPPAAPVSDPPATSPLPPPAAAPATPTPVSPAPPVAPPAAVPSATEGATPVAPTPRA